MDRIRNLRLAWLAGGLLVVLTVAAYWPVLSHGFTSYDDFDYVVENGHVQAGLSWEGVRWAFCSIEAANWHPLTWLSHMLDVQLFGPKAPGHHLTNLLLHLTNTLLVFLLFRRLTGGLWRSTFVAALFALHPLHVESVAWVAERKDVLSAFFFLLTLLAYVRYAQSTVQRPQSTVHSPGAKAGAQQASDKRQDPPNAHHVSRFTSRPSFFYALSLVLFALGLMSKPMLVTVPFVLLLLDYWPLKRMQNAECRMQNGAPGTSSPFIIHHSSFIILEKFPFLVLSVVSSIVTLVVQRRGGTVSSLGDYALSSRLADTAVSYVKYLGKAVWPTDLAVYYPHPSLDPANQWPAWQVAAAAIVLVLISALALLRRKQDGWLGVGWFWFLGMLVPVIGLVQAGSQAIADRYTYLPMIGIFVVVVYGLGAWLSDRRGGRVVVGVVGAMIVLVCAGLTRRQVNYWQDDSTLFGHALAVNERNAPALHAVGWTWASEGKYGMARVYCRAAVQADPSTWAAWHTLGDIANILGKRQEALQDYQAALRWNPHSAQTWFKLGYVRAAQGNLPEAIQAYQEALRQKPGLVPAHTSLGVAWLSLGKRQDALREFAEAARLSPQSADRHYNLGTTLADSGRLAEAEAELREAMRLKPDYLEARTALAGVLAQAGRPSEAAALVQALTRECTNSALAHFKLGTALRTAGLTNEATIAFAEAVRLEPSLPKGLLSAGEGFVQKGQLEEAAARFQALLWIRPDSAEAHERLGLLRANQGKWDEAVSHLKDALRLAPRPEAHYNLALALGMQGNLSQAIAQYELVLKAKPDSAPALNDLAWIRATAPAAELRNGPEGVRLAERACELTGSRNPRFLGTLAAAYAEAGRFAEAVATAEKARDLARAAGDISLAEGSQARLSLYQNHQPYRQ